MNIKHAYKQTDRSRVLVQVLLCILISIGFCIYIVIEANSLDRKFDKVQYGIDQAVVKQIMGRPSDSSWLPEKYVHIWHEKKMSFIWRPPFINYRLSKQFIVEFSSQGKVVTKRVYY